MRDIDEGDVQLLLIAADLDFHLGAQFAVEICQGLIKEKQRRPRDQAARQRDALLLPARQLVGIALGETFKRKS